MNAILKPVISEAERAKRKAAIDFARGSCRFEGIILDDEVERLNQRFINGELNDAEHSALCLAAIDRKHSAAA